MGRPGRWTDAAVAARHGPDGDRSLELQPVGITQELLNADLRDSSLEQIADRWLVFVEDLRELLLRVALSAHVLEDRGEDFGFDFKGTGLGGGKAQSIEDVALHDVSRLVVG